MSALQECRHCGQEIRKVPIHDKGARVPIPKHEGVYVDMSGGDVCCADTFMEKNVNGEHQPKVTT